MEDIAYDPHRGTNAVDRILLRGAAAGKSPPEISAMTNGVLSPAKAAQRVKDILAGRDWLTEMEQRQLLWDDLAAVKDMLYEKAVEFKNVRASEVLIKLLGTLNDTLAANKLDINKAMTQINEAHARLMLSAINLALERSLLELERRHPEVPQGELVQIMHTSFPDAVREIEARVVQPE